MPATAAIRWLRPDEGGRLTGPPVGPRYMATAILTDEFDGDHPSEAHFSVVIDFEEGQASSDESRPASVSTLAADLIGEQFAKVDQRFLVMEGDKKVAIGEVTSLDQAD